MQDKDKVTVVMATSNNATTIKRALISVTQGKRPANQIVVGDNDSSDGTYDVLCSLLGAERITIKDQTGLPPEFDGEFNGVPIKIFRKKLSTIGHTLNMAIGMKWQGTSVFGFMDPTSWYTNDKILKSLDIFGSCASAACVVSDCYNHYPDGREERVFRCSFDMQRLLVRFPYDRNFLVRSQVFQKLKSGFNDQMPIREEYDFLLRVSEIGLIYHTPEPLHHNTIIPTDAQTEQSINQCNTIAKQLAAQRRGGPGV
jgi:hypothetical protein